jgi:hypothetical protein
VTSWVDVLASPGQLLPRTASRRDVESRWGPPSAVGVDNHILSLEYWPESYGILLVVSWYRGKLSSIEANYRERGAAGEAAPAVFRLLGAVPSDLAEFTRVVTAHGGAAEQSGPDDAGWSLLSFPPADGVSAQAKFLDGRLLSIYLSWPEI